MCSLENASQLNMAPLKIGRCTKLKGVHLRPLGKIESAPSPFFRILGKYFIQSPVNTNDKHRILLRFEIKILKYVLQVCYKLLTMIFYGTISETNRAYYFL